jgi:hypothetical protein
MVRALRRRSTPRPERVELVVGALRSARSSTGASARRLVRSSARAASVRPPWPETFVGVRCRGLSASSWWSVRPERSRTSSASRIVAAPARLLVSVVLIRSLDHRTARFKPPLQCYRGPVHREEVSRTL